ncbi:hypothetical protein [Luteirhabdus pelagi]|uniref:hypothetical protein n=1 Tax=Luteirhabdus pelagi TaxID=2792783 RepID=UPI00193972FC|nr:hypothetical protein [Luteirhabdus pelagi]
MTAIIQKLKSQPISLYSVYVVVYLSVGFIMNYIGITFEIARFENWWQVVTCYGLYMIPVSVWLLGKPVFRQYAYGLVAMGLLEFSGYALQTSYVYPNNILVEWFGPYTFALVMAMFFAAYFPIGNWVVERIHDRLFPNSY